MTEIDEKKSRDVYFQRRCNFSIVLYGDRWELMDFWKNSQETTLCLARITDYPVDTVAEAQFPVTALHLELLEIQPGDVAQFRKSTPATREKAADWLRGRSKLLAATVARIKPGQRSSHEDAVTSLTGETGGFTLLSEQVTSGDGRKVDVTFNAGWQDPEKPAAEEDCKFSVGATLDAGVSELFEPSVARPSNGPLPVLLVTPQVALPKDYAPKHAASKDPAALPDKITTAIYPVAVDFMRVIQGKQDLKKRTLLIEALANRGLEFTQGTSATFRYDSCEVLLTHSRQGHLKFVSLLKELNLTP